MVYGQVLEQLDAYRDHDEVRLHLVGHSLGVTLTHDFLYGLFGQRGEPGHLPGFVAERQGTDDARRRFLTWRAKARDGTLRLGSLTSAASQLPIFFMRNEELIARIYDGGFLLPADIGVDATDHVQWQLFYDIDDALAMSTRNLYSPTTAIRELQVGSGVFPGSAHTGYWRDRTVIRETAELILRNATR